MNNNLVKVLIFLTILVAPLYLIGFSIFGIPTNVLELVILLTLGVSLIRGNKFEWRNFFERYKTYIISISLILTGLILSTFLNDNIRTGLGIIKSWFIAPLVFIFVLIKEIKSKEEIKYVLKYLFLSTFIVAITSIVYLLQGELTYDERLKAFYLSPNHLAMFLATGVFVGIYLFTKQKNIPDKILLIVSIAIIILSLYFTYSYTAWLAIAMSLLIISPIAGKKLLSKIFIALTIALLLLVLIFSQAGSEKFKNLSDFYRSSLDSRIMIWKSAGKILSDNIIFGIGPGNFQNKYLEYQQYFPPYLEWAVPQPHNLYLAFWLQSGIIGLFGFILLIVAWASKMIRIIKQNKNSFSIAAVLLGIVLYILIHGIADTPYWKNDLALMFWTVISLGITYSSILCNLPSKRLTKNKALSDESRNKLSAS